jgi:hypothetical protein
MPGVVDICNMALGQIVNNVAITGINPPSPPNSTAARTASLLYQPQADATFRAVHWNCARFQATATLLAAQQGTPQNPSGALPTPPRPWLYMYAYPADCLLVRFVFPLCVGPAGAPIMTNVGVSFQSRINTSMPFVPAIGSDQNGNDIRVILTNCPDAELVYTKRILDPNLWDPQLVNGVVAVLAAWFVNPIARDANLLKERVQVAASIIESARVSDGNEGITSTDFVPDWMQVRSAGSGWGGRGAGWGYDIPGGGYMGGWESIGMPNGLSY